MGYRAIGQLDDICPTCRTALNKRPAAKTKCPHCGAAIYARKRPLDDMKVLLAESDLPELEKDWERHYKAESARPKPVSPEWLARIAQAEARERHENPVVENEARRVFSEQLRLIKQDVAPRDAADALLSQVPETIRAEVAHRLWELQVRLMRTR
jgi:hypothetical protein